ncbi:unnamed protein product [Rhizoctonia solani]|uniref:Uncharacterized protein n=1 Tax=Rhizoctonia solani TaxID=456999 RepID=A0A8H2X3A6_9AGAM|nr:unnamed protein product [Rhizoctonia solani]
MYNDHPADCTNMSRELDFREFRQINSDPKSDLRDIVESAHLVSMVHYVDTIADYLGADAALASSRDESDSLAPWDSASQQGKPNPSHVPSFGREHSRSPPHAKRIHTDNANAMESTLSSSERSWILADNEVPQSGVLEDLRDQIALMRCDLETTERRRTRLIDLDNQVKWRNALFKKAEEMFESSVTAENRGIQMRREEARATLSCPNIAPEVAAQANKILEETWPETVPADKKRERIQEFYNWLLALYQVDDGGETPA